jgi:CubicO group peptidase (beta-lactamase class C family)
VGREAGAVWRYSTGHLTYEPDAAAATGDTIFDLASLTKVVATATMAMRLIDAGRLGLDDRVGARLRVWTGSDRDEVTISDLLAHASGLTAYLPFFRDHLGRREFEAAICALPLEYLPRSTSIYSDLGFILLGFILEDAGGADLQAQFREVARSFTDAPLDFIPPAAWRSRVAPTEVDRWRGRLLVGEVHDENAWALGGIAGHAGLFGSAEAVGAFARAVLRTLGGRAGLASPLTMRRFATRTGVPDSSRALGWDTMLPTSSCGALMSSTAIGHTGFTGTSLWIDRERDLYVVLLTNRVHPARDNDGIARVRPAVHDAVVRALAP